MNSQYYLNYAKEGSIAYVFALNSKTEGYDDPWTWIYAIDLDCQNGKLNSPFVLLNPVLSISANYI